MSPLETLGFALGTSFASGLNLYATVAAAGLFERLGIVQLPQQLQVLSHPVVLGAGGRAVRGRVRRRQDPVRGQRVGRGAHLHPATRRRLPLLQRVRGRRPRAVEDRGRPARRQRRAHLARREVHGPRGRQRESRAGEQLDAELRGGLDRRVPLVVGGDSSGPHRGHRRGARDPGAPADVAAVPVLPAGGDAVRSAAERGEAAPTTQ